MGLLDLLNEDIFLVEEEYNGSGSEVAVVADTVEQVQTLMHSVLKETNRQSGFVFLTPRLSGSGGRSDKSDSLLRSLSSTSMMPHDLTTSSSSTSTMS